MNEPENRYRSLPSVDALAEQLDPTMTLYERVDLARQAIDLARAQIRAGEEQANPMLIATDLARTSARQRSQRVINATGVLLHTNLGRSPVSSASIDDATMAFGSYTNVELDLETGDRGERGSDVVQLLRSLTGAEDALVVNNNAAAVFLCLVALGKERAVPVSRGELVEIGGSYRLPEVMQASGARLVEVGTTNKTRVGDFETALQVHDCGLVLRVHRANYEVKGFTEEPAVRDLADLSRRNGVPFVFDIGSGLLDETTPWLESPPPWLHGEPAVKQALAAGASLVTFSGDKLLGGPQAGVIVGQSNLVGQLRSHPLRRVLRVDAATDAALAATLRAYASRDGASIPFWRMATLSADDLRSRVDPIAKSLKASIEPGMSMVGAGSAPGASIDSPLIRLSERQDIFPKLLTCDPPILARRDRGDLLLDLRTVDPLDDEVLAVSVEKCL